MKGRKNRKNIPLTVLKVCHLQKAVLGQSFYHIRSVIPFREDDN
jgi:hypothetical protein